MGAMWGGGFIPIINYSAQESLILPNEFLLLDNEPFMLLDSGNFLLLES